MEPEEQIITFATYYDPMLAQIMRTRLEDNDIPCFIADENLGSMYPVYNNAIGGIKLKIFARDLDKCNAIIAQDSELDVNDLPPEANIKVTCPHCGSENIRPAYGANNDNWFKRVFSTLKANAPVSDNQWHCFNCGKDFEKNI